MGGPTLNTRKEKKMPIQLERELDSGHTANYWALSLFTLTPGKAPVEDVANATYGLYKSQEDFANKRQVDSASVSISGNVSRQTEMGTILDLLEAALVAEDGPLEGGIIL